MSNLSMGMQKIQGLKKSNNRGPDEAFLKSALPEDQSQIA